MSKGNMRIYYDEERDYLEIFIGGPKPNYGEDISEGVTVFKDEETDEIIGVGILNFREKAKDLKDIELKPPFKIISA
ncbi:DUF2283 domain-containing protein [Candidatus Pacearchaeota archaeon]|nr:DUF2283 domain-containing protein [Candidatus Pacearchaeota archaeon]